jgi:homoserine kinase
VAISRAVVYAPATVANLGVGFDVLGLALSQPGDTVIAEYREEPGVIVVAIEGDGGKLPLETQKNTAGVAASSVLRVIDAKHGLALTIKKGLPLASGLGSSAASAVAGAMAANALFGSPLTRDQLLPACLDGEASASGYHADNVAPCLFGGITLATGLQAEAIYRLPIPQGAHLALVTPNVEVPTAEARAVLPQSIPLKSMVAQTAAVACLVHAIYAGDIQTMGRIMEQDRVIEPARAHLMPKLAEVRAAAKAVGALGLVISGAGPTLMAICDSAEVAARVADAMLAVYDQANIGGIAQHTQIAADGAHVVEVS